MKNKQFIEFLGILFQKLEEIRAIFTILNQREESRLEVNIMAKKGKPKETKPKILCLLFSGRLGS